MEERFVAKLYDRHAAEWAALRARTHFTERKIVDWLIAEAPAGAEALDLGCGTGRPIAEYLASRGWRVTGVDGAEHLLARARNALPKQTWLLADMRETDLGRAFDAILAWDSFFHLPRVDQPRMFTVFARHAKPGTRLAFTSGAADGEAIGDLGGEPLFHSSLDPAEYRRLLEEAGFGDIDFAKEDPAQGGRSIWRAIKR